MLVTVFIEHSNEKVERLSGYGGALVAGMCTCGFSIYRCDAVVAGGKW